MMFLAKKNKTSPKDLGLDLLVFKEKKKATNNLKFKGKTIFAEAKPLQPDPLGEFSMFLTEGLIFAVHSKDGVADVSIKGLSAKDICDTILQRGLVSELDHALYMGRELSKAEIALKTKRSYVQDEPLFKNEI
jgi:dihydropteroate synthase